MRVKRTAAFRIKLKQVKLFSLLSIDEEEQRMRKMPSLLNIDSRPCVKTETEKHQKLINETIQNDDVSFGGQSRASRGHSGHVLRLVSVDLSRNHGLSVFLALEISGHGLGRVRLRSGRG